MATMSNRFSERFPSLLWDTQQEQGCTPGPLAWCLLFHRLCAV